MRTVLACLLVAGRLSVGFAADAPEADAHAVADVRSGANEAKEAKAEPAPAPAPRARPMMVHVAVTPGRDIVLNQQLHVDFTTLPRQVDGVDVAATVAAALALGDAARNWRVLGAPKVVEHEKTRTISIALTLLPRRPGQFALPSIPLTWLSGDQVAELGLVTVAAKIEVGAEQKDPPKEIEGVAGFAWGLPLDDAKSRIGETKLVDGAVVAEPSPGLRLKFLGGELAAAQLDVAGLDLAKARDSFLARWGVPQLEDRTEDGAIARLTWLIGWTRIVATPSAAGIALELTREDLEARLARAQVEQRVFSVLDGPDAPTPHPPTPAERANAATNEFGKPAVPEVPAPTPRR